MCLMTEQERLVAAFVAHVAAMDLPRHHFLRTPEGDCLLTDDLRGLLWTELDAWLQIGRASCRERV